MKEKIVKILLDELSYAYCDNCGNGTDDECGDCYRKYQNWKLGPQAAEKLANKILKEVSNTPIGEF